VRSSSTNFTKLARVPPMGSMPMPLQQLLDGGRRLHGLVDGRGHLVQDVHGRAARRMQAGPVRDLQFGKPCSIAVGSSG
jgi:hypothetical protein